VQDDGRLGTGSADEVRDTVCDPLDVARPSIVGEGAQGRDALSERPVEIEGNAIAETASFEEHGSPCILKNNVFEPAFDVSVTIDADGAIAECGAVIVHDCRFSFASEGETIAEGAEESSFGGAA